LQTADQSPLGKKFQFNAVMFQGMKSGDEMIIRMRFTACIDQKDCMECSQLFNTMGERRKRSIGNQQLSNAEFSESSQISFRVYLPHNLVEESSSYDPSHIMNPKSTPSNYNIDNNLSNLSLVITVSFITLFICLSVFIKFKFNLLNRVDLKI